MHMPPEGGTGAVGGTASVTVSSVKDVDLKKYEYVWLEKVIYVCPCLQ